MHNQQIGRINFGPNSNNNIEFAKPISGSVKITCKYCCKPYVAYKKGRTHCSNSDCRSKEIKNQLDNLEYFMELFLRNKIEATIEFRFPGNDKLSSDAKINSVSHLSYGLKEQDSDTTNKICLQELIDYFRPVLWKGVKGNFIVKTLADGTISSQIFNETFTKISSPVIIGNNLIVKGGNTR